MKGKLVSSCPFTILHVKDKSLVIRMLQYEEKLATSSWGQEQYRSHDSTVSLDTEHLFNRKTLTEFGFDTSDTSVSNYRSIFRHYYKSTSDYDADVIGASYYMRNNRCLFYKAIPLAMGDTLPDCPLYKLDGSPTSLYEALNSPNRCNSGLICAFSSS
jgi:hypothetical protein